MHEQIQKALQLIDNDKIEAATELFDEIADIDTSDVSDIVQRGRLAQALGENVFALRAFSAALKAQPENTEYMSLQATAYEKTGNLAEAVEVCKKLIELDPRQHNAYLILGNFAAANDDHVEAIDYYRQAIQIAPDETSAYVKLVRSMRTENRHDEALAFAQKLLELDPLARYHIPLSRVLIELGRVDEGMVYLEKALQIDPTCGYVYQGMASVRKYTREDNELIEQARNALEQDMPDLDRSLIHFSLGKIYNDRKQWDEAFKHYKQGNRLGRVAVEPKQKARHFRAVKKVFTRDVIEQPGLYGSDSAIPVFIIGMPRSGTTLTEQIIASHPQAAGAGELREISKISARICADEAMDARAQQSVSKQALVDYADAYLKVLRHRHEDAARVVDKMPDNYIHLGMMHKLFPNARFIHTIRNPLDTCLSCFFQPFEFLTDSYDLKWLGRRYRLYREAMEYWRSLLPEDAILDVRYEDVVSDFENQSRRIIDFCELPWDDSCTEFYRVERPIVTASVWQARQPVYSSSKRRWVNYAPHLEGLATIIADYLDDEDLDELEKNGIQLKRKKKSGLMKWFGR